ncbi:MAG: DNA repair protein RadC [Cyclobacteriaceae bacterium]|nr:DNA repair protein RadC [Cyclobacteriaceae bacterium]
METYPTSFSIKKWAEEDRPREKLLLKGKSTLSDAELIGILIGSGTPTRSAVDLSKEILASVSHNLNSLARMSVHDLKKFKGIGEAKAISIVAALELGRRRKETESLRKPKITSSKDVYEQFRSELLDLLHEEFWLLLLRRNNEVIRKSQISKGGISGTVVDPKMIFKAALDESASAIILVHNHPSGNLQPSQADIQLTRKLKSAGEFLELPILDHLIFTNDGYFSFADESLL